MINPAAEIAACRAWLEEHKFPCPPPAHQILSKDLSRFGLHRAVDFIAVWEDALTSGFPMERPIALALSPVGGQEGNATRVELRCRARLEAQAKVEADERLTVPATDPLAGMFKHKREFVRLVGRLVALHAGGTVPAGDFQLLTRCDEGFKPNGSATPERIQELREYLDVHVLIGASSA